MVLPSIIATFISSSCFYGFGGDTWKLSFRSLNQMDGLVFTHVIPPPSYIHEKEVIGTIGLDKTIDMLTWLPYYGIHYIIWVIVVAMFLEGCYHLFVCGYEWLCNHIWASELGYLLGIAMGSTIILVSNIWVLQQHKYTTRACSLDGHGAFLKTPENDGTDYSSISLSFQSLYYFQSVERCESLPNHLEDLDFRQRATSIPNKLVSANTHS